MTEKRRDGGESRQSYKEPQSGRRGRQSGRGDASGEYYGSPNGYQGRPEHGGAQGGYQGQSGYGDAQGSYYGAQGGYQGGPEYGGAQGGYQGQSEYGGYQGQSGYGNAQGGYYGAQGGYQGGPEYGGAQGGYYDPQGYYQEPQNGKRKKKKKKKKHSKLLLVLEIIVLLFLALGIFSFAQLGRVDRVKLSDILVNSGIAKSGYRNIALFGVDSRTGQLEGGTNSDTIMVASINQRSGDIKLVSVYRDTYLDNTNGEYRKATECFSGGGAERSVNMLNKNLDLDIKDFVTVDFNAIIKAVDLLGGIELDITEEERGWLNGYLVETSEVTGVDYTTIDSPGLQQVTGIQAMAYCRIRYTEGWDYKRTERQRIVLEQIFQKAQAKGVAGLIPLVNVMMDYVSTSLSNTEIISLASGIAKYSIADTTGFPFEKQGANIAAGDCVVPVNLAANVTELHRYLFGEENYTPSQTVQEISNKIISDTGIQ